MPTTTTLISDADIKGRIRSLAAEIEHDYPPHEGIHLVAILKGGFMFMADLVRAMSDRVTMDFMAVSSYGKGTTSSGQVRVLKDLDSNVEGRHVILVEDIVDSGLTLSYLVRNLQARSPATLEVCALLTKPERRQTDITCRYVGFEIPNRFAIGYGLDYGERYRSLPYVAALDESRLPEDLI